MAHPEKNYIIIVPEQFTMQTQKELVLLHPDHAIMNIDILSFARLAHRVFEEVGADRRTVLTETGKNLMLRKVAIREKEHLQVLGSRMDRPGYVSEVKSVISELMQYEITEFELQEMERFAEKRPLLHAKLQDLHCLYRAFLEYRRDRFLKPEELYDVLCQVAGRSQLLKRSILAFDGFAGFTPAQLKVLEELLTYSPQVYLSVTLDARESAFGEIREHDLFAPSRKLVRQVTGAAQRGCGMTSGLQTPVVLGKEQRWRFRGNRTLDHLEQNLFRTKRVSYGREPEGLSLHISQTPASEVHFAARTIAKLVRQEGFRYREIAIITGDLSSYNNYIKKIFPMYDIPAFLDETRQILLNPCLEFVRGALELAQKDFTYESVFRCLRTGMAGLSPEEIDRLENYVLATGIRGRRQWAREWAYHPGRMEDEELANCNRCREEVMEHLDSFARQMRKKGRTLSEYARALYELLADCGIQQQLADRAEALDAMGARGEAREYEQIYGILIGLLDEMAELLGDEPMDVQEFTEILEAGLSEAKVGVIPPGIDEVQVGDIRRSRLAHVRVLFFLGLNDGWVPSRGDGGGIVSDMERELLKQTGIELAPSAREQAYIQRFYLYQNLTKPDAGLYLSWCLADGKGAVMHPSYLVSVLQRLFPQIRITEEQEPGMSLAQVTSKESGMLYLARQLQELSSGRSNLAGQQRVSGAGSGLAGQQEISEEGNSQAEQQEATGAGNGQAGQQEASGAGNGQAEQQEATGSCGIAELFWLYGQDPEYAPRVRQLARAAFADGKAQRLTYHTSRELYGAVMKNSVTRLEQFAACAFAHFAQYGLRLTERTLFGVQPADLGILFHRSLELFSHQLACEKREWVSLTEQEQKERMERCVDQVLEASDAQALYATARSTYTVRRLKRILCRSAWALHEQLAAGSFQPSGFEVAFDGTSELAAVNVKLGTDGRMRLLGRIDRIDTAQTADAVYVKIVDYKSGMTQFDPVSLYYGLQLQLVVYLNAALEMEEKQQRAREVIPAGIFYYHLQDPMLEKEAGLDNARAREQLLKKLRPDGILNSDEQVLRMLDHQLSGDSLVIPAGLKKDGSLKLASRTVTTEQFHLLSRFVEHKMKTMGQQMMEGEVAPYPAVQGEMSACTYCQYAEVCGFDRKLPGMREHALEKLSGQEVWERLAQECDGEEIQEHAHGGKVGQRMSECGREESCQVQSSDRKDERQRTAERSGRWA